LTSRIAIRCFAAAILFASVLPSAVSAQQPLRITSLGDSITAGYTDNPNWTVPYNHGYRSGFYNRLVASGQQPGVDFNLVGNSPEASPNGVPLLFLPTLNTGDWSNGGTIVPETDLEALGQNNHRGYGGAGSSSFLRASTLPGRLQNETLIEQFLREDDPDVILLKLGTNGININTYEALVDDIFRIKPDVSIVMSEIFPFRAAGGLDNDSNQRVIDFNNTLRNSVFPKFQDLNKDVVLVDNFSGFTQVVDGDVVFRDGLHATFNHPNNDGYDVLAENFFNGFQQLRVVAVPEPSSTAALAVGSLLLIRRRRRNERSA
jgi:lysophospholipase L1-like esterase